MSDLSPRLIRLRGLTKSYGVEPALAPVDLDLGPGEHLSLLGRSGTGKSTLLSLVAGLQEPSAGTLDHSLAPEDLAFVFQDHRLLPWKTLRENMVLGNPHQPGPREVTNLARRAGIEAVLDKYPHRVSGGQRQRATLARAFLRRPRLLLLDEPFASLDEQTREALQDELLALLALRPCAMILVTHSLAEALYASPRVLVLGRSGWLGHLDHDLAGRRDDEALVEQARRSLELRHLLAKEDA